MIVILDGPEGRQAFSRPKAVIRADTRAQVPGALAALEAAGGSWRAGWMAYELGYALEPRLRRLMPPSPGPLLCFGIYDAPAPAPVPRGRAYAGPLAPDWDEAAYAARFARVEDAIAAGDIYQANLSFRARFAFAGDPLAFYERLRAASAAPYCAYVDDGACQIVSLSPELFFAIENGVICARPMKGTRARGSDDAAGRAVLAASVKDRAENLMIVDLIRNDLGRVAEIGSVHVENLFAVETYPTLHAMVSTVTARLKPMAGLAETVAALFPCGSVTGAPKIRAMEILRDLETGPRGAYCGAIGVFAPASAGQEPRSRRGWAQKACFNVAIRTITLADGRGALGIGGAVVRDSRAADEYAECLLKARFLTDTRRPLFLIETLGWQGGFCRLDRHLARMRASAAALGLSFREDRARRALAAAVAGKDGPLRVRLTLDEAGAHHAVAVSLPPDPPRWTYAVAHARVWSGDALLRHKTGWREFFEAQAAQHAADEVLFLNERGELTEGSRSTVFVRRGDRLLTPPLSAGLLPGCLRAELLAQGVCAEAVLRESDLVGEVFLGNSLRGLIPAVPAQS